MIYGNSSDPVYIKKIYLKIWPLRAEVESVIRKRVANGEDLTQELIDEVKEEYRPKPTPIAASALKLVENVEEEEDAAEGNEEEDL